jgi:hypothetical protein
VARREDVAEARHPIDGRRRLVVSSEYRRARDHPRILSRLQSELSWFLRILEGRREVSRCEIRSWTGEFDAVSPAPDGSVAVVRWSDQTEAGLVLVELTGQLRQLEAVWDTRETNWLEGPTWAPDSQLLALVENPAGAGPWWAERTPGEADDDDVSPGGTFTPGSVVALDRRLKERVREKIAVDLPRGWFPSSDTDRGLGAPAFDSSRNVVVQVPNEGAHRITPLG